MEEKKPSGTQVGLETAPGNGIFCTDGSSEYGINTQMVLISVYPGAAEGSSAVLESESDDGEDKRAKGKCLALLCVISGQRTEQYIFLRHRTLHYLYFKNRNIIT